MGTKGICDETHRRRMQLLAELRWHCAMCGRIYTPRQFSQKFCDRECTLDARNERERLEREAKRRGRACAQCGDEFTSRRADAKFCSDPCRWKARNAAKRKGYGLGRTVRPYVRESTNDECCNNGKCELCLAASRRASVGRTGTEA